MTLATHCDITMANDVTRDTHCDITMGNDVTREIHCDITMSNDISVCTYLGNKMHNDVAMNLVSYVLLCLFMLFYYGCVVWIKTRTGLYLISLGWRTHELFLCTAISLVLGTCEIALHKNNSCVLSRQIKHSLVLVIISYCDV